MRLDYQHYLYKFKSKNVIITEELLMARIEEIKAETMQKQPSTTFRDLASKKVRFSESAFLSRFEQAKTLKQHVKTIRIMAVSNEKHKVLVNCTFASKKKIQKFD